MAAMNRDNKALYVLSTVLLAGLLFLMLVDVPLDADRLRWAEAAFLLVLTLATCFVIRRRGIHSIRKREVFLVAAAIGVLYVVFSQMTGLAFGYYKNPYFANTDMILKRALPYAVIIISVEVIRAVFLAQKSKLAAVACFAIGILSESLMLSNVHGITSFNKFMDLVGMTLFPALTANILYNYVGKNFGAAPNVAFRLITTLYIFAVPTTTAMPDALSSCLKIVLPLLMLVFLSSMYEKKRRYALEKGSKLGWVATALAVAIAVGIAMLISCQFRYGALVIATESMTGEINKGDMILYERYEGQRIEEGQVIVFLQNDNKIVHRVIEVERLADETRYYTKGDANDSPDAGYRTDEDIFGLTDTKIPYVGQPTLWLRELISK